MGAQKFQVKKATEVKSKLRMAIDGPAGSGKTWTSLEVARVLAGGDMTKVLVLDTERETSAKYSREFGSFDIMSLTDSKGEPNFDPDNYSDAMLWAENQGYEVMVIDSLSHAWTGKGGAIEQVDNEAARSQSRNSFTAWRNVTPKHNRLVDTLLQSNMHIIATMRTKVEYAMEEVNGKKMPVKLGMAPIQREGMDYEFDVVIDMANAGENGVVSKTRCSEIAGRVFKRPGADLGNILKNWLESGEAAAARQHTKQELITLARLERNMSPADVANALRSAGVTLDSASSVIPDEAWEAAKAAVLSPVVTEVPASDPA